MNSTEIGCYRPQVMLDGTQTFGVIPAEAGIRVSRN
jgi:hypothetical protein